MAFAKFFLFTKPTAIIPNMSLSVGIIGLPNVGKSTLFNALLKRQIALAANYPFATIEPNVGIVDVPDTRLDKIYETVLDEYHLRKAAERVSAAEGVPESTGRSGSTLWDEPMTGPAKASNETAVGVSSAMATDNRLPLPKKIPAVAKFVDIAGLAPGAHKGEGLGNKFLSHIREANVILHVVRAFEDENVIRAGSVNPQKDIELINTELILKDIETVQKMLDTRKTRAEAKIETESLEEIFKCLNSGKLLNSVKLTEEGEKIAKDTSLLTIKPQIIIFNISESATVAGPAKYDRPSGTQSSFSQGTCGSYKGLRTNPNEKAIGTASATSTDDVSTTKRVSAAEGVPESTGRSRSTLWDEPMTGPAKLPNETAASITSNASELNVSAKLESELSNLSEEDQKEYLKQLGINESGLDKVIRTCYALLGYKNFFTAGPKEVRAWQFTDGMTAQQCAGVIHTDFEKGFIAADVVDWKDYVENNGWKNCKDKGLLRLEGRDYKMRDGDLVIFRVNTR